MKYAQIRKSDISNGEGIGVSLWTQGCPYHCAGCHNPDQWDRNGGKELTDQDIENMFIYINKPYISRFSILGGEPLLPENITTLLKIVLRIKEERPDIKVWVWTGTTLKDLLLLCRFEDCEDKIFESQKWNGQSIKELVELLNNIDYLIDGRFIQEQKDLSLKYRGSKNQKVYDMRQSIQRKAIVYASF